jgi:hypothetical protein
MITRNHLEKQDSLISSSDPPLWLLGHRADHKRAVDFLIEVANCQLEPKAVQRLSARFPEMCSRPLTIPGATLAMLRHRLQEAWKAPTARERELWLVTMLTDVLDVISRNAEEKPRYTDAWSHVAWAIWEGLRITDWMRVCLNPDCDARYFVAQRRSQKYCSHDCAAPAIRELKRVWWNEHGREWTKTRKRPSKLRKSKGRKQR